MNNSTDKIKNKYNSTGEYTRLVKRIVSSFLISSVAMYIYISCSNNFPFLLLADDMAYAVRSCFAIGTIGWLVVRWIERKRKS